MSMVLYTLAVLACPVAMGLMMFMMMRGHNKGSMERPGGSAGRGEVEALPVEIEALRADRATQAPDHP